jgi:error-prone DNA polymerase
MTSETKNLPNDPAYAELQAISNFSFLRGASHPDELMMVAKQKGLHAIAIADHNSFAGTVRAHVAAKEQGIKFIPGVRLNLRDAPPLLCYPTDRAAYGRLCRLLSIGKRRAPKGECELYLGDLIDHGDGCLIIAVQPMVPNPELRAQLQDMAGQFEGRFWLSVNRHFDAFDQDRLTFSESIERDLGIPVIASNDVHIHTRARKALQDVLVCIREHCNLDDAGYRLFANAERNLKSAFEMTALFPDHPEWLTRTAEIADACTFSLDELSYQYPDEGNGAETPQQRLTRLTWDGAKKRFPNGLSDRVQSSLEKELALVDQLNYAPYFLTVYDIVSFAHSEGILCQGRGSSANSAICYCLYITEVNPDRIDLLFERFISAARAEPPDIDVDFEHERREEVIQHIYERYGRDRAGLTATVITYRARSAVREVGKVFGLSDDVLTRMAKTIWGWGRSGIEDKHIREVGLSPEDLKVQAVIELSQELMGFPRHLSQHVGGFVITQGPLSELSPVANAAMADRTTIEWDKNDIDALGILKIDVLGLGMLSCIRKSFTLLREHKAMEYSLATLPEDDKKVYGMLQKADAIGVFQIESRAQLSMLPRLKPKIFYDLVVQVAIVRPGPIQGGMVHPYLRRRMGKEQVEYPSEELRAVLEKTFGVPLFQEQAMQVAIVGAGFTPEEADRLRRDMASFRRIGQVQQHRENFMIGMQNNGYTPEFAERCFKQIEGFADYGFPESHAASFANLVYVSAWLKCHHPEVFACALLNSQPMGFYAPAQIVRDASNHGVKILPVDVNISYWDNQLEARRDLHGEHAIRLGFRQIKGVGELDALALINARPDGGFTDLHILARDSGISARALEKLAEADAFASLGLTRRDALWAVRRLGQGKKIPPALPLFEAVEHNNRNMAVSAEFGAEKPAALPVMSIGEEVIEDYASLRFSLKAHPVSLLRDRLDQAGIQKARDLAGVGDGKKVSVAGLIIARQRPGTASGVVFMTVEDESEIANVIVWPKVFEKYRRVVMSSTMIGVSGKLQHEDGVTHLIADRLLDLSGLLQSLSVDTHIFSRANRHPRNLSWKVQPGTTPNTKSTQTLDKLAEERKGEDAPFSVDSHDFH